LREGRFDIVASWDLVDEIVRVLRRPKLRRKYSIADEDVADLVAVLTPTLPTIEYDVPTRDPSDAPVVAAALAGNAEAIVTGDGDFIDDAHLRSWLRERGIDVLDGVRFLDRLA
jgi:putative PIN family toxin of toxin-antitoxin system